MQLLLPCIAALAFLSVNAPSAQAADTSGKTQETVTTQLPRNVRPTRYELTLTPDAGKLVFTGHETISIEVLKPTTTITLNQAEIMISGATLTMSSGKPVGPLKIALNDATETATFTAAVSLTPGRYRLTLDYTGKIHTQTTALFALDYDQGGTRKRALFTHFENSDARRFLPSWDEPFYKAVFQLNAIVPNEQTAISNLPALRQTASGPGKKLITFGESPKMSSYLLFFALGDFERATTKAAGVEIGLVTKKGDLASGQFGLSSAAAILPWYNQYFGTPFPLPKLDNVVGPGDSPDSAAMENWGAIFYYEKVLLLDPHIASEADRESVFNVVAHEMAHQWFGDLVTMSWWDDLWLNEGFASWMAVRASEHFHPEWNTSLAAVVLKNGAESEDALATTHPVIQHIATVDQAAQAFDGITYYKGGAVIRMLEAYTGDDGWRDGVRAYMHKYAYQNSVTDDLWREVESVSGKPITQIAHDFTLQPGVPLIRASTKCIAGNTQIHFDQAEFTKDRPTKVPLKWHVPVSAVSPGGSPIEMLVYGSANASLPGCGPVIVNAGQTSYFRTSYSPAMFATLASNFSVVQPVDQLAMISDSFALGLAGVEPLADVLDLVRALPATADPQVVSEALGDFDGLISIYSAGVPGRTAALVKLATAKFLPILNRLGWTPINGEPAPVANLRAALITTLGEDGEPSVVAEAKRRFAVSAKDPSAIPASLRTAILSVVAAQADTATWDALHAMAKAEPSTLAKSQLYVLLGSALDPVLADKALKLAITAEPGPSTSTDMINAVAFIHAEKTFDFAVANQKAVMANVDRRSATQFIPQLTYSGHTPELIDKLQAWTKINLKPDAMHTAEEAEAQIRYRIAVRTQRMPAVDAWLKARGY